MAIKTANNSKIMRDREKVYIELKEARLGLSESAIILVAIATEIGEALHSSPKKPNKPETGRDMAKVYINH